jgi:cytochrome c peroxidase
VGDIIPLRRATSSRSGGGFAGISNFPPAPKLDPLGQLDPSKATPQELAGERVFTGKGRCAGCHVPEASFMDNQMHDLKLERFYQTGTECEWIGPAAGWTHQDVHASRYKGLAAPTCMMVGC